MKKASIILFLILSASISGCKQEKPLSPIDCEACNLVVQQLDISEYQSSLESDHSIDLAAISSSFGILEWDYATHVTDTANQKSIILTPFRDNPLMFFSASFSESLDFAQLMIVEFRPSSDNVTTNGSYSGEIEFFDTNGNDLIILEYVDNECVNAGNGFANEGSNKLSLNCFLWEIGISIYNIGNDCGGLFGGCAFGAVPCIPFAICVGFNGIIGIASALDHHIDMEYWIAPGNVGVDPSRNSDRHIYFLASSGTPPYEYKIDNGSYQSSNYFILEEDNDYILRIRDSTPLDNGCVVKFDISL